MTKFIFSIILLPISCIVLFFPVISCGQSAQTGKVKWLTFEKAIELNKKNPKKLLVDVYTDWCGWCKHIDKNTYSNKTLADYINKNFYPVKLNAEQKEPIKYNGKTFIYKPDYKTHEIALNLLQGKMSYPTTVFLNESESILTVIPGYLDVPSVEKVVKFYGENHHEKMDWKEFEKMYKPVMK